MTDIITNAAYFLPDGTEVIYAGETTISRIHSNGEKMVEISGDLIWFPRDLSRGHEHLDGRTLSPRMVECDAGHRYHLQIQSFPGTVPCPECKPAREIEVAFEARNFSVWGTGGGCTAWGWTYPADDGTEWRVMCSDDCIAPRTKADLYAPVIYIDAMDASGESLDFAEVAEDYGEYCAWSVCWAVDQSAADNYALDSTVKPISGDDPEFARLAARDDIPEDVKLWVHEALAALQGEGGS